MSPSIQRVYLHIGAPKTGTTYLQDLLWSNREAVVGAGLLYPGDVEPAHFFAAVDLQPDRYADWSEPSMIGAWDRLVSQVEAWSGPSIISHELLCTATAAEVKRVMADLAFAEVHVICTARDLARQIPSSWQENIKTLQTTPYPEFLTAIRDGEPRWINEQFWGFQDLGRILRTWGSELAPQRVHVVTVPQARGGALLRDRFASVLGIDPDLLQRSTLTPNHSLSPAEAELVRRLNLELEGTVEWQRYTQVVKQHISETMLPARAERHRIPLPASEYRWVHERTAGMIAEITEAGYDVVGDLADLVPAEPREGDEVPLVPSEPELLPVAIHILAELVKRPPLAAPPGGWQPRERWKRVLLAQYRRIAALRAKYRKG
ncbi:MAG: hypothetical protein ACRDRL_03050 [Sciscionella sp.]